MPLGSYSALTSEVPSLSETLSQKEQQGPRHGNVTKQNTKRMALLTVDPSCLIVSCTGTGWPPGIIAGC